MAPATESERPETIDDAGCGLDRLPRPHSLVLRLHALGADADLIAECLGIEPQGVGPLLDVAHAKLLQVRRARP